MLYLKYRPNTIANLDNTHVKDIVNKLLSSNQIPHALLFIGQKGTGKTSTARIFAKAVNCLKNKFASKNNSSEPCNSCDNCTSIARSTFTDVLELDAASNRGIEEIKNLIRETTFLPMAGRYRVFIIDEAHMITPDGFNALLKTLEEPPKTAIFILATTNPEKLPKTISSRCLRINFGKGLKQDIIQMLKKIVRDEDVKINEEIINLIAVHSEDSFRDATKILEEIIVQKISSVEETEKFLGIRGKSNLIELIEKNINAKTEKEIFEWIIQFSQSGGNFKSLIIELLDQLRGKLLHKKGVLGYESGFSSTLTLPQITLLIKLLMEAYQQLKYSPIDSLPLEIAFNEFYNKSSS